MAISVDWNTFVISVPKSDTDLVSLGPPEVRSYDVFNKLWKELKAIEASEVGMVFTDAQIHYPEVTVGGVTLADVVIIIPPYTVEFEAGAYQINLVGANHNVLDKAVMNQTALRSSNSAGLIVTEGGGSVATAEAFLSVAYDEAGTTLRMQAWLERSGAPVADGDLVSCYITVYDHEGNVLFAVNSSTTLGNGRFGLEKTGLSLASVRPFAATVQVTDDVGTVTTYHTFSTSS